MPPDIREVDDGDIYTSASPPVLTDGIVRCF